MHLGNDYQRNTREGPANVPELAKLERICETGLNSLSQNGYGAKWWFKDVKRLFQDVKVAVSGFETDSLTSV